MLLSNPHTHSEQEDGIDIEEEEPPQPSEDEKEEDGLIIEEDDHEEPEPEEPSPTVVARIRSRITSWIEKRTHKEIQSDCKEHGIRANQKRITMNKLLAEKMIEKELVSRMKRSQEGWVDPEDAADLDWTNLNHQL